MYVTPLCFHWNPPTPATIVSKAPPVEPRTRVIEEGGVLSELDCMLPDMRSSQSETNRNDSQSETNKNESKHAPNE